MVIAVCMKKIDQIKCVSSMQLRQNYPVTCIDQNIHLNVRDNYVISI